MRNFIFIIIVWFGILILPNLWSQEELMNKKNQYESFSVKIEKDSVFNMDSAFYSFLCDTLKNIENQIPSNKSTNITFIIDDKNMFDKKAFDCKLLKICPDLDCVFRKWGNTYFKLINVKKTDDKISFKFDYYSKTRNTPYQILVKWKN